MKNRENHMTSDRPVVARPTTNDPESWRSYWDYLEQYWRLEPEIPEERQRELSARRHLSLDLDSGIVPFQGLRLNRADVEWLLATHESRGFTGPVDHSDPRQFKREGIKLIGADLTGANLRDLPLTGVQAGLFGNEWFRATPQQRLSVAGCFDNCDLRYAHLERAKLSFVRFNGANLAEVHLEGADLFGASFIHSNLELVYLDQETKIENVALSDARGRGPLLADIHFAGAHLGTVDWSKIRIVGEELQARGKGYASGYETAEEDRLLHWRRAVRAYRQMATHLRDQGMTEVADRFAYRAQISQRRVLLRTFRLPQFLFSWLLALLAGYGYRPSRTLFWYLVTIASFAYLFMQVSQGWTPFGLPTPSQLAPVPWYEALILSVSAFHGRGFFQPLQSLGDPVAALAALEAVIGLFIEISFIATFTQRFFSK
jgi:uncharacterized protein YjbI with pentapeptide repeats